MNNTLKLVLPLEAEDDNVRKMDHKVDLWSVYLVAVLLRETFLRAGGESTTGAVLRGDAQEAFMIGLDRLVTLSKAFAEASAV